MNCSNRSALSAVNIKVLLRAGGVDDSIGKRTFLCTRREQLSLYLTGSKYFSMYMFACIGWVSKSQRDCVSKEWNTTTNCFQFHLQQTHLLQHKLKRPLYLSILIKQASSYLYFDSLETNVQTNLFVNAKISLFYNFFFFCLLRFSSYKNTPQPSPKRHVKKLIMCIFIVKIHP